MTIVFGTCTPLSESCRHHSKTHFSVLSAALDFPDHATVAVPRYFYKTSHSALGFTLLFPLANSSSATRNAANSSRIAGVPA